MFLVTCANMTANVLRLELRGGIWKRLASISVDEVMKTKATIQKKLAMSFSSC